REPALRDGPVGRLLPPARIDGPGHRALDLAHGRRARSRQLAEIGLAEPVRCPPERARSFDPDQRRADLDPRTRGDCDRPGGLAGPQRATDRRGRFVVSIVVADNCSKWYG